MITSGSIVRQIMGAEVLLIDQDKDVQHGMTQLLDRAKFNLTCVDSPEQAYEALGKRFYSVVVVDLDTPMPSAGLTTVATVKERSPTSMIVLLTPRKSFDDSVEAVRLGAIDIVFKAPESVPYLKDRIMAAASRSVDTREVNSVLIEIKTAYDEFLELLMDAERRVVDLQDRVAGRDPNTGSTGLEEIRLMIVDSDMTLGQALTQRRIPGYEFHLAVSGGQALDLCGTGKYHYVIVGENLFDLPSAWVIRSIKTQFPDVVVLAYSGMGKGCKIELVEMSGRSTVVDDFAEPAQLIERLDDLAEAFRAKARESRYTQAFRERHYNFLRRYVELKMKIERTLASE